MKIAIIGGGISGIYAAHELSRSHDVTLYETNGYLGGHTDTHHVTVGGSVYSVDTGFIVFNEQNYPLFTAFLQDLGVEWQTSDMSFSVSDKRSGLEYNATNLAGLLSKRGNLMRPGFYRMLFDIFRFYRRCPALLHSEDDLLTIGDYLSNDGYGDDFVHNHIVPMASALWSSPPSTVSQFPARYFVAFMQNHRMLQVSNRPLWRTVTGGSSQYVKAFQRNFQGRLLVNSRVLNVERRPGNACVTCRSGSDHYDLVVMACHSDQALRILSDASPQERRLLESIPYQVNQITLHSDPRVMPQAPKAWASWNVVKPERSGEFVVTYFMNSLQNLDSPTPLLVSLNADHLIEEDKVLLRRQYHHPVYSPASLAAQQELKQLSGQTNTYFAGAYLGWGFHEDGVRSARQAVEAINSEAFSCAA